LILTNNIILIVWISSRVWRFGFSFLLYIFSLTNIYISPVNCITP